MKWYKSKKDVRLARLIWFFNALMSIYFALTIPEPYCYAFWVTASIFFLCSFVAGRWSYKE